MSTRLLSILLLLTLTLFASVSWAATPGPYLEIEGYGTWLNDSKNQTDSGTFNADYDGGPGWGVAVGYDLVDAYPGIGSGRLELEAASRRCTVQNLAFAEGKLPATGTVKVKSLMANTIVEYHHYTIWVPYLALGAGYAEVSVSRVSTVGTPFIASCSSRVFAYQVGTGLGIEINDHLSADIGYRYFATQNPTLELADGSKFKSEFGSHNILLGLRFKY
ncbi:MAG: outer membrane beta-barrel protein [Deltaproteobacteria bacterium]